MEGQCGAVVPDEEWPLEGAAWPLAAAAWPLGGVGIAAIRPTKRKRVKNRDNRPRELNMMNAGWY